MKITIFLKKMTQKYNSCKKYDYYICIILCVVWEYKLSNLGRRIFMKRKLRQRVMAIFAAVLMVIGTFPTSPLSVVNAETTGTGTGLRRTRRHMFLMLLITARALMKQLGKHLLQKIQRLELMISLQSAQPEIRMHG